MILLDHCVPRRILHLLRSWNYPAEVSTAYLRADATDLEIAALAQQTEACLLTLDLDFANVLNYPPSAYFGIIVMRYAGEDEARIDNALRSTLFDLYPDDLVGALVIVSAGKYRIRRS